MGNISSLNNKTNIKAVILKKLNKEEFKKNFLIDNKGQENVIYFSESNAKFINSVAPFGFFKSEDEAIDILMDTLRDNVDAVAEWLLSGKTVLVINHTFNKEIGFIFDENEKPVSTTDVALFLNRSENSEVGFYVKNFTPNKK